MTRGGFAAIPTAVLDDETLSTGAKMTLLALSSYAGCSEIRPGRDALARLTGYTVRSIAEFRNELRDRDLIEWKIINTPTGHVSVYRLLTPWGGGAMVAPPLGGGLGNGCTMGEATIAQEVDKEKVDNKRKKPPAAPEVTRPEVKSLCSLLADRIVENGSKPPEVGKAWHDACRLMLDKDGRTEQQIRYLIEWSQRDEFWRTNILSMPTLRKQFDKLRLASMRNRNGNSTPALEPPRSPHQPPPGLTASEQDAWRAEHFKHRVAAGDDL